MDSMDLLDNINKVHSVHTVHQVHLFSPTGQNKIARQPKKSNTRIMSDEKLIPIHGGYRNLKGFQVAQLAYDITVRFCDKYIDRFSRTRDQMIQAARSGVQNIAEGS